MKYTLIHTESGDVLSEVDCLKTPEGKTEWTIGNQNFAETKFIFQGSVVEVRSGSERVSFYSQNAGKNFKVASALGNLSFEVQRGAKSALGMAEAGGKKSLKSQIPGKVMKILCNPGDTVEAGQPLLIIEAMKMENEVRAPQAGQVDQVSVQVGQKVENGDLLLTLQPLKK